MHGMRRQGDPDRRFGTEPRSRARQDVCGRPIAVATPFRLHSFAGHRTTPRAAINAPH
jgi:hypothetical protein